MSGYVICFPPFLQEAGDIFKGNENAPTNNLPQPSSWLFSLKTTLEAAVKVFESLSISRKRRPDLDPTTASLRQRAYNRSSGLTQHTQAPRKIGDRQKSARPKPADTLPLRTDRGKGALADHSFGGGLARAAAVPGWGTLPTVDRHAICPRGRAIRDFCVT